MMSHDCVVVPGWGALIAQYSDSFYNKETGIINKPQRKVGFNSSVSHNDGLLAQSIVRREGITYDQAVRFIADSVVTFKQQLLEGNDVSLGRLGFFHSNEGLTEFIPFYHETRNDQYFGLRSINFKTLAQLHEEQGQEQEQISTVVVRTNWTRRAMQIAASVILLIALVPVLTTPMMHSDDNTLASLNLPEVKKPSRPVFNWDSAKTDLAIALPEQAFEVRQQATVEPKVEVADIKTNDTGRYYLVISSLSNEKQVREYLGSHHDLEGKMQVLKRGNKYRIYIARDNNAANLYKVKATLPDRYGDAWVCD